MRRNFHMKHDYHERKQNRIDHAEQQAAKHAQQSDALWDQSSKMASAIPMGQPILVGHHSEKRDRNYRAKIESKQRKSHSEREKARYYDEKAEIIANNTAISSDDPDALTKLREKLERLECKQAFMKAANKCIRKMKRDEFLTIEGTSDALWAELTAAGRHGGMGYAHYEISNNNANIRTVKQRIASLERVEKIEYSETQIGDITLIVNTEVGRVQLKFPGIPDEEKRKVMKSNGFVYCRSEGAWQRKLNSWAILTAKGLAEKLQ